MDRCYEAGFVWVGVGRCYEAGVVWAAVLSASFVLGRCCVGRSCVGMFLLAGSV